VRFTKSAALRAMMRRQAGCRHSAHQGDERRSDLPCSHHRQHEDSRGGFVNTTDLRVDRLHRPYGWDAHGGSKNSGGVAKAIWRFGSARIRHDGVAGAQASPTRDSRTRRRRDSRWRTCPNLSSSGHLIWATSPWPAGNRLWWQPHVHRYPHRSVVRA